MPYIALTRLKVGETDEVLRKEPSGLRVIGEDRDGRLQTETVYQDVHAPIYREPGDLVPEAESWTLRDIEVMMRSNQIAVAPETRSTVQPRKRSGTVKAS